MTEQPCPKCGTMFWAYAEFCPGCRYARWMEHPVQVPILEAAKRERSPEQALLMVELARMHPETTSPLQGMRHVETGEVLHPDTFASRRAKDEAVSTALHRTNENDEEAIRRAKEVTTERPWIRATLSQMEKAWVVGQGRLWVDSARRAKELGHITDYQVDGFRVRPASVEKEDQLRQAILSDGRKKER